MARTPLPKTPHSKFPDIGKFAIAFAKITRFRCARRTHFQIADDPKGPKIEKLLDLEIFKRD